MLFRNGEIMTQHGIKAEDAYPGYTFPKQGEQGDYPEELGADLGDVRRFGFLQRKYYLRLRTSCESSAKKKVEEIASEGTEALITWNPIRLETYGVWERVKKPLKAKQ